MKKEKLHKPFGEIALKKEFITLDQLLTALNTQMAEDIESGEHRLIGSILYEHGAINAEQFNEVKDLCWFTRINEDPEKEG